MRSLKLYEGWDTDLGTKLNRSLSAKVFLGVAGLLILCCLVIYGSILLFLPKSYTVVASQRVTEGIQQLTDTLSQTTYGEIGTVIETFCRANGVAVTGGKELFGLLGELSQRKVAEKLGQPVPQGLQFGEPVPVRPPVLCPGCPHRGLFYTLHKLGVMVSGDIGCYTLGALAPLSALDTTVCMGASISGLHGFNIARGPESAKKSVAVIGDSTFMHSGITGLIDITYNRGLSTVIVLDNSITGMTGHQQNPTTGLTLKNQPTPQVSIEKVCEAAGVHRVRVVDPNDLKALEAALKEELAAAEPSVVITRRPCALLKYVQPKPPLAVNTEKCRYCKACMRIGCPAISLAGHTAQIDPTLCVGCGLCVQLCAFGAIGGEVN